VVAPVTFKGFTYAGAPEAEWLKTRDPEQVASWENDKATMGAKMLKRFNQERKKGQMFVLDVPPKEGQFVIAINFDRYDGQMRSTAEIRDSAGAVVDIVRDPMAVTAEFNTWMAIESGTAVSAHMISKYLHSRASPEAVK